MQPGDPGLDQIQAIETHIENSLLQARQLLWLANGGKQDHQGMRINPANRRVTFRLKTPKASEVLLAGDFNGWDPQANSLKKDRNGFWKTTLILPSGRYEFKFMVAGRWRENLETELTAPNGYGTLNDVVVVGGD